MSSRTVGREEREYAINGSIKLPSSPTAGRLYFMDYITKYLEWKASYTIKAPIPYRLHLERFFKFVGKEFTKVTLDDFVKYQHLMKLKYSMANVAYSTMILKNFFKFWRLQNVGNIDPYLIRIPKFTPNSHTPITKEEIEKILASLRENEFYTLQKKLIISLLWDTGVRISELADLNVNNIDARDPAMLIKTKKNNKMRWIMWSQNTHILLLKYLGVRISLNENPALFIASENGRRDRASIRTIQRWIKKAIKEAGIVKRLTAHSFRHGKAHEILNKGGNPKHIQVILGHSEENPKAAFSYLRLNNMEFKKTAKRFL